MTESKAVAPDPTPVRAPEYPPGGLPSVSTGLGTAVAALARLTELPTPVVEVACDFLRAIGGSRAVRMAGGAVGDIFSWWRWRNRLAIAHEADEVLKRDGIARRIVPPSFLLPLLDHCGDAEDPELQARWAQLLASAVATPATRHPMWITVLAQMSTEDVRSFSRICAAADARGIAFVTADQKPYWPQDAANDSDARLAALNLVIPIAELSPAIRLKLGSEELAKVRALPSPVGAQFRRAVSPGSASAGCSA